MYTHVHAAGYKISHMSHIHPHVHTGSKNDSILNTKMLLNLIICNIHGINITKCQLFVCKFRIYRSSYTVPTFLKVRSSYTVPTFLRVRSSYTVPTF